MFAGGFNIVFFLTEVHFQILANTQISEFSFKTRSAGSNNSHGK